VNPMMVSYVTGDDIYCDSDSEILEHFGITFDEANELFNWDGCGNAKTPLEAAAYIEGFVARKMLKERPATSVYRLGAIARLCDDGRDSAQRAEQVISGGEDRHSPFS